MVCSCKVSAKHVLLQIMFCSWVIGTMFLRGAARKLLKYEKQTWCSNDSQQAKQLTTTSGVTREGILDRPFHSLHCPTAAQPNPRHTWQTGRVQRMSANKARPNLSLELNKNSANCIFFWLVSGRNSTNPALWLVPGVGRIFSFGPLQRAESVELIFFLERTTVPPAVICTLGRVNLKGRTCEVHAGGMRWNHAVLFLIELQYNLQDTY